MLTEVEGHIPEYNGSVICEYYTCSCGWESGAHWDGIDFALDEWKEHVLEKYGLDFSE